MIFDIYIYIYLTFHNVVRFPVEILGKRMTRSETLLSSEQRTPLAMLVMASRRTKSLSSLPRMVGADEPIW